MMVAGNTASGVGSMSLSCLLDRPDCVGGDTLISGLQLDSRKVCGGDLFLALPGDVHDGRQFIEQAVANGTFREDFYYRLNVFPIYLPPLRKRPTDVLLLAESFMRKFNKENKKQVKRISTPAIDLLTQYHWPGNVRELQNCIERALLICDEDSIKSYHLPPSLQSAGTVGEKNPLSFAVAVENFEKELLIDALKNCQGNQTKVAKYLDSSLRIINYKINKYKIDSRKYKVTKE